MHTYVKHSTNPEFSQVTIRCGISQRYAYSNLEQLKRQEKKISNIQVVTTERVTTSDNYIFALILTFIFN